MKADDKVQVENDDGKKENEKYSHFEELKAKVEVLQEQIEVIGRILHQNDLTQTKETHDMNPDFNDEIYRKLDEEI